MKNWLTGTEERCFDPAQMPAVFNQHCREIEPRSPWDAAQPGFHPWADAHGEAVCQGETVEKRPCNLTSAQTPTHKPVTRNLPAIQTMAMPDMDCIVSKNWLKHPYFHTG